MTNSKEKISAICDYDEAFTRREMYEETNFCIKCFSTTCPYHIEAITDKEIQKR